MLSDDPGLMKQTSALYTRADVIIQKFSTASLHTELMLFKTYCTPVYVCQLWCYMFQYLYRKLDVAYNEAFRQLLAAAKDLCCLLY